MFGNVIYFNIGTFGTNLDVWGPVLWDSLLSAICGKVEILCLKLVDGYSKSLRYESKFAFNSTLGPLFWCNISVFVGKICW